MADKNYISGSYQQYWTYTNNTIFYSMAPTYLRQWYMNVVNVWDQWINGWVNGFHDPSRGLMPTRYANALSERITNIIYGKGIIYEKLKEESNSLNFIGKKALELDLDANIHDAIKKSVALGNSLVKLNTSNNNLWIDVIPGNRFYVDLDAQGNVIKSKSYVDILVAGTESNEISYGLLEERYYKYEKENALSKTKKKAYVKYSIYRLGTQAQLFTPPTSGHGLTYKELPPKLQKLFRESYPNIYLEKEIKLPFNNLGVFLFKHTRYISNLPNIKLGESFMSNILNFLWQYDVNSSEIGWDMEASRQTILIPEMMVENARGNFENANKGLDSRKYQLVNTISQDDQKPIYVGAEPRISSLSLTRETLIKQIANNIGVSVNSLDSSITDGKGQVTATQINSEESNTADYASKKRIILINEIQKLIDTILLYYGQEPNLKVTFPEIGSNNQLVNTEIITKKISNGTISTYQAIKDENPTWTEEQIEKELERINITKVI